MMGYLYPIEDLKLRNDRISPRSLIKSSSLSKMGGGVEFIKKGNILSWFWIISSTSAVRQEYIQKLGIKNRCEESGSPLNLKMIVNITTIRI